MEKLIETLKEILRPELDAEFYARALWNENDGDHFEIKARDTFDGIPRTYYFSDFGIKI